MYIEGWGVDGFGVFHDYEERGLPAGLCLFLGPNEAGKSTLLAFLRGVLFGFPARKAALHYPPQHGGRHGGRVFLGGAEGPIAVEREVGAKAPRIIYPDDVESGDVAVRRLLGGVDDGLFRSVFAFGLAELADLGSLSSAGVSERIFSAGIAGAGPIAGSVSKRLDKEASELVRPRSGGLGNELLRRLGEAERPPATLRGRRRDTPSWWRTRRRSALRSNGSGVPGTTPTAGSAGPGFWVKRGPSISDLRSARGQLQSSRTTSAAPGAGVRRRRRPACSRAARGRGGARRWSCSAIASVGCRSCASSPTVEAVALQRRLADLGAGWDAARGTRLRRLPAAAAGGPVLVACAVRTRLAGVEEARRVRSPPPPRRSPLRRPRSGRPTRNWTRCPRSLRTRSTRADEAIRRLRADLQSLGLMDNDLRGRQAVLDDRRRQVRATAGRALRLPRGEWWGSRSWRRRSCCWSRVCGWR